MDPMSPEALLAGYPGPQRDIAEWLRGVVARAVPGVTERVRAGWRIVGYDAPVGARRPAYFAWVMVESVHVHLGFPNGVLMADRRGLLDGVGITKKARWVTLTPDAMLDEDVLAALCHEAVRVATLSRGERIFLAMSRADEEDAET
jgi:hypothetical protein